jgi:imidazoleglycerol phosphate dehydratase HisB
VYEVIKTTTTKTTTGIHIHTVIFFDHLLEKLGRRSGAIGNRPDSPEIRHHLIKNICVTRL